MSQKPNKFIVVILNYNGKEDTLECLRSLALVSYPDFEVLIVDNGSTDDSVEQFRLHFPQITLIENKQNLGFAEGNNKGIEAALRRGADWVVLLNNDTVVAPDFLHGYEKALTVHPDAALLGAKIFYYDEPATIWYAGGGIDRRGWRLYHIGQGQPDTYKDVVETGYACGCALAIRRDIFEKHGGMDPDYFLIWEEVDLCYRLKKEGIPTYFAPSARVWHKISRSFNQGERGPLWDYFYERNRLLFMKKHASTAERLKYYWKHLMPRLLGGPPLPIRQGAFDYFRRKLGVGSYNKFLNSPK